MKRFIFGLVLFIGLCGVAIAQFDDPFTASISLEPVESGAPVLLVRLAVPDGNHLYKDMVTVKVSDGLSLEAIDVPAGKKKYDELTEKDIFVYEHDVVQKYAVKGVVVDTVFITVDYQGCSGSLCFAPETKSFNLISGKEFTTARLQIS